MNDKILHHLTNRENKIFWNGIFIGIIIGILIITLLLAFVNKLV